MKRFQTVLVLILISLLFLSGCGSSPASTQGQVSPSTGQSSTPGQDSAQGAAQSTVPGTTSPDASAASPAFTPESFSVSWTDAKSDVVSPFDVTKPDGLPDGHFSLTMNLPQPVVIQSIFIRYSEFGKEVRWDWIYDNHLTPAGYSLAVFEKGTLLPSGPDTGIKRSGQTVFELFAAGLNNANGRDTFAFESGQNFQIELNYITQAGERKVWRTTVKTS